MKIPRLSAESLIGDLTTRYATHSCDILNPADNTYKPSKYETEISAYSSRSACGATRRAT